MELPQVDGIPVKEKIIRFFVTKCTSREEAEEYYDICLKSGLEYGVELFDKGISMVCEQLDLDETILIQQIHGTQLS